MLPKKRLTNDEYPGLDWGTYISHRFHLKDIDEMMQALLNHTTWKPREVRHKAQVARAALHDWKKAFVEMLQEIYPAEFKEVWDGKAKS